jgi:hypothetical protein
MLDRLQSLVDEIRDYKMTPEEIAEQRIAFAYGNAQAEDQCTKEEVREAINSVTAPKKR